MEKEDFLRELEYLGLTARIKRLSDSILNSIRIYYQHTGLDIEPSWHLVFLKVKEQKKISMQELSKALHISKPAVSKIIKKMLEKGYVSVTSGKIDNRKKVVSLTPKAKRKLPLFQQVWDCGQLAVQDMLDDNQEFMESLTKLENQNSSENFAKRALKRYQDETNWEHSPC